MKYTNLTEKLFTGINKMFLNRTAMEDLTKKLRKFANDRDWEQFHSPKNLSMALAVEVAEILEHDFDGLNAIFFLDDFHKLNKQLLALFTLIREMLERVSGVQFLIFTRSTVPFYDRREVVVKKLIVELELEGLTEEDFLLRP